MDINAKGTFLVSQAVSKVMRDQDPLEITLPRHGTRSLGRGSIVNVASAMSHGVVPSKLPYAVSKHALLGITRAFGTCTHTLNYQLIVTLRRGRAAIDLKSYNIRVNQVSPIWVRTPLFEEECRRTPSIPHIIEKIVPEKRAIEPDEVASTIQYLCGSAASFVTGSSLVMDAGMLLGPVFS